MSDAGFMTATSYDHRQQWLQIAAILSLIYSFLCLAARFVGKWDLLWIDDIVLGAAYVAAIVHWGLLFQGLAVGLGVVSTALSGGQADDAARFFFASRIPFFLAHCLAKLSILVFTRRIFTGDIYKENIFFGVSYALTALYGILAVLLSSAGCRPDDSLIASVNAVCDGNVARWIVVTILDGVTELVILAMPMWFISKNQLHASKKLIVIFVYAFRLVVIAFSIATTTSYFNFLNRGRDNIDIAPVVAWTEVLLGFSLVSSSFPCLKSFLWAFMSRGLTAMYGDTTASRSDQRSHNNSVPLRSLNRSQIEPEHGHRLRPERDLEYSVHVRADAPRHKRSNNDDPYGAKRSDDSDRMIIRHETSYRVESNY